MMRRQLGFTLVEAMVGVAILTVLALAMAGTFLVGYRAISNESRVIAADTAVSDASMWLTRDLNSSNNLPSGTVTSASTVSFTYGSPAVTVTYSIDGSGNFIRTAAGMARVIARGMTSVGIGWTGCYGTVTILPSASGASSVVLNVSNRPGGCL
jgi:prepilin-type N-terminal cleavage/methylation domain-containing protein